MLIFVFSATIFRYFQLGSLTWAEEASRYLMIWLAFAGISLGFKKNAHLGLSFLVSKFPKNINKFFYFIRAGLIVLFGSVVSYYSYLLISNQLKNTQLSPAMGIPVWWVYSALLFGGILMIIRTLQVTLKAIKENNYSTQNEEEEV